MNTKTKRKNRARRHKRVRAKIRGTSERPRVCVFKSNKNMFVQFVDDDSGKTLISNAISKKSKVKGGNASVAGNIGKDLAKKAKAMKINKVLFDSGGFKYHGRIKALADGLRQGGLKF